MRIFFVSDVHGSVKCFRKLVSAGKFYGADLRRLILERTEEWVALAADRPGGTRIRLLTGLSDDDFADMVPYLHCGPVSYGDGWLRQRLGGSTAPPPPPTPPLAADGARFR